MNIQVNLFIDQNEYEQVPSAWSGAGNFITPHGVAFGNACNQIGANKCWVRPFSQYQQQIPELFEYFGLTREPCVIFIDLDSSEALAALRQSQISTDRILAIYESLNSLETVVDQDTGVTGYTDGSGKFLTAEDIAKRFRTPFGLGLFNLDIPVPAWLWLIAGAAAGHWAINSPTQAGQWLYGGASAISFGNYLNKKS